MIPEIWNMTDRIFCHFGPFFALLPPPLKPLKPLKSKFWNNEKNNWRYYHFTQVYKNHDHMLYCSRDMVCDLCNCYCSFWTIFCPFVPLTARKMEISSFYTCIPKIMIRWCTVPEIWCAMDRCTDGRMDRENHI